MFTRLDGPQAVYCNLLNYAHGQQINFRVTGVGLPVEQVLYKLSTVGRQLKKKKKNSLHAQIFYLLKAVACIAYCHAPALEGLCNFIGRFT